MYAIQNSRYDLFIDLGGVDIVNLNFCKSNEDGTDFECPLFMAAVRNDV